MVNAGVSSAGLDVVGADGGQVGEQAGEAVYRDAVLGAFARGFGERLVGALGRGDGVGAFGGCAGFVVVVEQDWGQGRFHVPADVIGQHPQEHVGATRSARWWRMGRTSSSLLRVRKNRSTSSSPL